MGMGFARTWLRQLSPLLHMTTLTTAQRFSFLVIFLCYFLFWVVRTALLGREGSPVVASRL